MAGTRPDSWGNRELNPLRRANPPPAQSAFSYACHADNFRGIRSTRGPRLIRRILVPEPSLSLLALFAGLVLRLRRRRC